MVRALLLQLLEHPSRSTVALQRTVMLVLIDCALTGARWGRRLSS